MIPNYPNYPIDVIEQYLEKCTTKIDFHSKNAKNAQIWNNVLSLINISISALCALTMTILTVTGVGSTPITCVGASYAFVITIATKLKEDYKFNVLEYAHNDIKDDFAELKINFEKLKYTDDYRDIEKYIIKYEHIMKTSHLQTVKSCKFCCLCTD